MIIRTKFLGMSFESIKFFSEYLTYLWLLLITLAASKSYWKSENLYVVAEF